MYRGRLPPDAHVRQILDEYRVRDGRIRVCYRQENGGISAASNTALEAARGEFTALLDHDDELEPDALAEIVASLLQYPDADMIYTDEDKIDESGFRFDPFHKPDWSARVLPRLHVYLPLGVYRTRLLRDVNGFRPERDGSQDYDLVLRLMSRARRIHHVPKILYHWRTLEASSTASGAAAKDYAYTAARKALADYAVSAGFSGEVDKGPVYGSYRVRFGVPTHSDVETIRFSDNATAAELNARGEQSRSEYLLFVRDSVTGLSLEALIEYCQLPGLARQGRRSSMRAGVSSAPESCSRMGVRWTRMPATLGTILGTS